MPKAISSEKEKEIIELSKENLCIAAIARKANVTDKVVKRIGEKHKILFAKADNSPLTDEDKIKIVSLFEEGYCTSDISKITGYKQLRIYRTIIKAGLKIPKNMITMTSQMKQDIISMYKEGVSSINIANKYDICDRTVIKILKDSNIEVKRSGKKAIVENESYFESIDTEEKAYFLGFIIADGNVMITKNGSYVFQMTLQSSDYYILERLRTALGIKVSKYDSKKRIINIVDKSLYYIESKDQYYINCVSKKLFDDLGKYGVIPNKTFNTLFPKHIPKHLIRHFIRGYFDGDGCVTGKNYLRIIFYGQRCFLDELKEQLQKEIPTINKKIKIFDKPTLSMLTYGSRKDVSSLYRYFYDGATIYLERKKSKFDNFKNFSYADTEVTK